MIGSINFTHSSAQTAGLKFRGTNNSSDFQYSPLSKADVLEANELLAKAFMDEPTIEPLGLVLSDLKKILLPLMQESEKQGLGVIAKENGKIVGVLLNIDNGTVPPPYEDMERLSPMRKPILDIIVDLENIPAVNDLIDKNEPIVYFYFLGTSSEHRGQGIGKKLVEKSLDIAKQKKYKLALIAGTAPGTQIIVQRLGFTYLNGTDYKDHKPFTELPGTVELYIKPLT